MTLSRNRLYVITAAMMLSLFLASMEGSIVATAMPTIVAQLGGLSIYAWVFSVYMLTSTTTLPVFGKLSDIYGRRPVYLTAVAIFLAGSALCGMARSMPQLVAFRALQGIGAGGILPLAFTIIGDIFTLEQRARIQGLFSSVWGVSSVMGPLVGGFLVDHVTWHWVFYLNLPPGLLAAALMILAWRDVSPRAPGQVDYAGAVLLSASVIALLLAMFRLSTGPGGWMSPEFWLLVALAAGLLASLIWVERRAANPIVPLQLFSQRLFAIATSHGFLAGFSLFGSSAFIPLFAQTVLGTSATVAGATLMPMTLSWVLASIVGTRLLLKVSYRALALIGMTLLVAGMLPMTQVGPATSLWLLGTYTTLQGLGMGLCIPAFLIAVQSSVPRQQMGTATSNLQFSRNVGGTVGVSLMGVILALRLASGLRAAGLDPQTVSLGGLLDPLAGPGAAATLGPLRGALAAGVRELFVAASLAALAGLAITTLTPRGRIGATAAPAPETSAAGSGVPVTK